MEEYPTLKLLFVVMMLTFTVSVAQAYEFGPPDNRAGNPPAHANCTQCHNQFPVNSGLGHLALTGIPTGGYVAGLTYNLHVTLSDPQAHRWGFELTAMRAGIAAGTFTITAPTLTQLSDNPGTAADFVKHMTAGTFPGTLGPTTWNFNWTAPIGPTPVTFYFAGNAANNDTTNQGDYIYTDSLVVPILVGPQIEVNTTPVSPPIVIPANGGSFPYNINAHNYSSSLQSFQIWNKVRNSAGLYTQVFGPIARTLPGGANPTRVLNQTIAGSISSGTLYFISYIGTYPSTISDSSFFTITKSVVADGGPWISENSVSGNLFDEEGVTTTAPMAYALIGNYPNPFNPTTTISYSLPQASFVNLSVFDLTGRQVAELVNGWREIGIHDLTFDGSALASGTYYYRLTAGDYTATGKMALVK